MTSISRNYTHFTPLCSMILIHSSNQFPSRQNQTQTNRIHLTYQWKTREQFGSELRRWQLHLIRRKHSRVVLSGSMFSATQLESCTFQSYHFPWFYFTIFQLLEQGNWSITLKNTWKPWSSQGKQKKIAIFHGKLSLQNKNKPESDVRRTKCMWADEILTAAGIFLHCEAYFLKVFIVNWSVFASNSDSEIGVWTFYSLMLPLKDNQATCQDVIATVQNGSSGSFCLLR